MTSAVEDEAHALALLQAGDWEQGVASLRASGAGQRTEDILERVALRMLARGDLVRLRLSIAGLAPSERTLALRITDLDAATRLHAADLPWLEAIADEAAAEAAAGGRDHRWWVEAIRAEHFLWRGEWVAMQIALQTLAAMPEDPVLPAATLAARGRLRRIVAVAELFAYSADGPDRAFATLDRAVADLSRAGWEEERCFSAGFVHTVWTGVSHDDVARTCAVLGEATDRLEVLGSPYAPLAHAALAFSSLIGGDLPAVHRSLAAARSEADDRIMVWCDYIDGLCRLIGEGPSAQVLRAMDRAVDGFRLHWPEAAGSVCSTVAAILVDFRATDDAARWFGRSQATMHVTPYAGFDRDLTGIRLSILSSADPSDVGRVDTLLGAMRAVGLHRDAAWKALRVSHDCAHVGLVDEAVRLHAEGRAGLVPGPVSLWEALFGRPLDLPQSSATTSQAGTHAGARTARLLAPVATLVTDGGSTELHAGAARLIAALADGHGPVTTDRLIDRLWPDVGTAAGRNRLRVTLHRLRKVTGSDELVVRRGDDVAIADGWGVDAWSFTDLASGDVEDRVAAWRLYTSPVCATQLAYDDAVLEYRDRLHARWVDLTRRLVADSALDPVEVADRAERVGLDDPGTAGTLAAALAAAGHAARAEVWRKVADA